MVGLAREREVAVAAAERAARAIMAIYESGFAVDYKDDAQDDPVTHADRTGNAIVVDALRAAFPDDVIVAEESAVPPGFGRSERCWFVDPLDGTKEFVARNGEFCVMVGLAIGGRAALGVVVAPAQDGGYVLIGEPGVVSERRDRRGSSRVTVSTTSTPADARLLVSRSRTPPKIGELVTRLGVTSARPCGSVGVKIAELALDHADVYVHVPAGPGKGGPKLWDLCAPEAILVAAGGRFTDIHGASIQYQSGQVAHDLGIVATNGLLHPAVLDALADL
ncbi:MAG: 3'(2'),5'-bisphosphate nucleotidase CysQ [Myxococcales bacterium]|nr:3'(2'),5'-bisphosphate nucleotidase CysQ [Myxococcales bacterium]